MSDQFQHVMVLTSIIIGLAITNLLPGPGAVVDRITGSKRPLRLSCSATAFRIFRLKQVIPPSLFFVRPASRYGRAALQPERADS